MKTKTCQILLAILMLCSGLQFAMAEENGVAKVVIVKGDVFEAKSNRAIKKDDWLKEGESLKTSDKAFAKLIFIDKSTMNIGPKSEMVITSFQKDKAGIIDLVQGQIRSKVTKNYMEMDKEKSKLFIKTRTAAMGVRGTDFQVNFNPDNMNTSLITFEGAVAMGAIAERAMKKFSHDNLEKIVSDSTAVMVKRGQFSGVMPGIDTKPVEPIKINSKQLKALEKNDGSVSDNESKADGKQISKRNLLPPGVSSEEFQGASKKELMKEIGKVDQQTASKVQGDIKIEQNNDSKKNESVSGVNTKFREGGLVNTEVVAYIAPPKNAAIDPISKQPIIPVSLGSFDQKTGLYKNDFFKLQNDLTWKPVVQVTNTTDRLPASTTLTNTVVIPGDLKTECINCATTIIDPNAATRELSSIDTGAAVDSSYDKIDQVIDSTQQQTSTKVKFQTK